MTNTRRLSNNSFSPDSNHRLLRMKLFFNEVLRTRKLHASRTQKTTSLNQQTVQTLVDWKVLEDMEEDYAKFVNKFKNCIRESENPRSSNAQNGT